MVSTSKPKGHKGHWSKNYFDLNGLTKTVDVTYRAGKDLEKLVTVTARYVEVGNEINPRATVVGLSGSPGSHNDFKYMRDFFAEKNLRLLCFNWPGSEFVTGGMKDSYTNPERNSFATALMEKLNVEQCNRIILMGHSRGGENALQLSNILADRKWPIIGIAMINSPGFEPHQGIKTRRVFINAIAYLVQLHSKFVNFFLFPILDYFYNKMVGLRVADGKVAAAAILPLTTFAFEKQLQEIKDLGEKPNIRAFYGYGAKDFLVEEYISEDFAMAFKDNDHYLVRKENSEEILQEARKSYLAGTRYVTANFTEEGHYLQKTYPGFVINILDAMVQCEELKEEIRSNTFI